MQAQNSAEILDFPATVRAPAFRWPADDERVAIVGTTGSGKTTAALWILANHSFDRRPWIVIDTKREILFRRMLRRGLFRRELSLNSWAPRRPGLYLLRAGEEDDAELDEFLWRVYRRGRTGIFVDEGHAVAPPGRRGSAFRAILTRGRSRLMPVISLSQRPTNVDTFLKSEAQHLIMFFLVDSDDEREMHRYMRFPDQELPEHWAYWYNTKARYTWRLPPVPEAGSILARIAERIPQRRGIWG